MEPRDGPGSGVSEPTAGLDEDAGVGRDPKLAALLAALPDVVFRLDREGRVLEVHAPPDGLFLPVEQVLGRMQEDLLCAPDARRVRAAIARVIASGGVEALRVELPAPAGRLVVGVRLARLDATQVVLTSRDITAQVDAERSLRDGEERLRELLEGMSDVVYRYRLEPDRGFEYVTPSVTAMTGYTPEDHYRDPDLGVRLVHPEDRHLLEHGIGDPTSLADRPLLLRWVRRDGRVIWTEQRNRVVTDESGAVCALLGVAREVTDREEAAAALRRERDATRAMIASLQDGLLVLDATGRVVEANDRALELLGRPAHRVIDRPWPQPWWPTEDAAALRRPDAGAGELETTVARPAGDRVTVIAAHAPLRAEAGEGRPGVVITLKDVTARRRAELALRRAAAEQEGLRRVSEAIVRGEERDPVLARVAQEAARVSGGVAGAVVQQDGKALRIVARWGRGADPPAGPEGPPGAATARRAVAHDRPCAEESAEGAGVAAWHVAAPVRVRGRVWGAVLVTGERHAMTEAATGEVFAFAGLASMAVEHALQLEERERLEQELHQAQKMEALGQLASGVAHEINTPIQFVGDSVAFLVDAFGDLQVAIAGLRRGAGSAGGPAAAEPVDAEDLDFLLTEVPRALMRTEAGVERVAEIVRAMRAFAHPSRASRRRCSLNEVVRSALTVAHNELKHVAEVSVDLDEHLPEIDCAPSEIGQVALNLLVNAAHAIGDLGTPGARGVISVGTRRGAEAGQVELLVADTGVGIPPAVLPRIFEPFFTTKEVGRGSGQGLALAHRVVVDDHGGRIDVDSTPGGGSTFRIVLPVGG